MRWTLDPTEVDWGMRGSSSGGSRRGPARNGGLPARKQLTLTLTHRPTGLTVEATVDGPFTRTQAKLARAKLYSQLFAELEVAVANALRIPGRG